MAKPSSTENPDRLSLPARFGALLARVQRWKPVRVWTAYSSRRGPILAAGLGYSALFACFAALWAGFSLAGVVVSGDLDLREEVLALLAEAVPGLIKDGDGTGAIDPALLLSADVYGVSGAIALVGLVITALGWPAATGDAVRAVAGLPPWQANIVLVRLVDLGFGVGLGLMLGISALLAVSATSASEAAIAWLGLDSGVAIAASRTAALAVVILLEAVTLLGVYRLLAGIKFPARLLREGLLLGTAGLAALTVGGSLLLGTAGGNPLIASFAVVAGLLVFFNLVGQVILVAAAWMAVSAEDAGIELVAARHGDRG